jgi:hypothetical protein
MRHDEDKGENEFAEAWQHLSLLKEMAVHEKSLTPPLKKILISRPKAHLD